MYTYYKTIADSTDMPVILYNNKLQDQRDHCP
ncbi:MAG: hypothetical protein ACLU9S_03690 [Oscillospiraceae bacterium]